jgi:GT2 family glycosyltransferase
MITASLVLYNTAETQVRTVVSCVLQSRIDKLYIIDNSPIPQAGMLPLDDPRIVYQRHENTGYGSSHNIGLRRAIGDGADYHVVLNPDIIFEPVVIEKLEAFLSGNRDVVHAMPKITYPDGENQYLCKLIPSPMDLFLRRFLPENGLTKRINDRYILKDSGYDRIMNPPCLSGCFMFLRVSAITAHSLFFDERFFMYCEDFDLMRRLHRVGKTAFYPEVTVIHDHGRESYTNSRMLRAHVVSAIKYFNKYGWFFDVERSRMNREILCEIEGLASRKDR